MKLTGKRIGFAVTGSYCTLEQATVELKRLVEAGAEIQPILSEMVLTRDSKYGPAKKWIKAFQDLTARPIISSIVQAEPIGPGKLLDLLIIVPCTGNTIAKLANGIIDETVIMATKAHLRNDKPVLIAIATNDGLGLNAKNLGILLNTKNIYFVPFGQDNPSEKRNSLVARFDLLCESAEYALESKQIQPILIEYRGI